ncbi:MAG TPA: DUF3999 domain-containing protein [Usitatibacter sp.]
MRMIALATLAAALNASAEAPSDFRSAAPITVSSSEALHRLTLPFEAYRDARRDLGDLRIFNAHGDALPIAFAGDAQATREASPAVGLPIFPVSAAAPGRDQALGDLNVVVRSNSDGTLVSVQGRTRGVAAPRPVAWLLDASQVQKPVRALVVEWDVLPGTEIAKVTVEASDDLKAWRTLASRAPVVRLEQSGQELVQPRVELGSQRVKYLRITAEPAAFRLRAVKAEPEEVVRPAPRLSRTVAASPGTQPGEYLFDLGAGVPVEALRVVLPAVNSVAPFTVASRESEKGSWQPVVSATFYRLIRDGAEIQSPAVEIGPRRARYWSIRLDPRSPPIGDASPALEVQWRPAQIVFVARGDKPYRLAFGNPQARAAVLSVTELIPGYEPRAELKLPEAKVGEVGTTDAAGGVWRRLVGDANPRKLVLWGVLLAAVLALGWMASRLRREMRSRGEGEPRG